MKLQYISDSEGKTTGVYIPIEEWNALKQQLKIADLNEIPAWQQQDVNNRQKDYHKKPDNVLDFNLAMDNIEKNL